MDIFYFLFFMFTCGDWWKAVKVVESLAGAGLRLRGQTGCLTDRITGENQSIRLTP